MKYINEAGQEVKINPLKLTEAERIEAVAQATAIFPSEFGAIDVDAKIANIIALIRDPYYSSSNVLNISPDVVRGVVELDQNVYDEGARTEAEKFLAKLKARYKIEARVGDIYDLVADLDKKLGIVTGLMVRLYRYAVNNVPIPEGIKTNYDAFTEQFATSVDAGIYRDISDIENPEEVIPKLMMRDIEKTNITEEYKNSLL